VGNQNQLRSFGPVVLTHLDAAYNLARWLVRDAGTAEDAVHEACMYASRSFASFRGESARAWLLGFVRETCYSRLGPHAITDDEDLVDLHHVDDGQGSMHRYDALRIDRALAALPATWRECVVLRDMEGLSYQDMAGIIDVPVSTVMSRLVRARHALRRDCTIDTTASVDDAIGRRTSCG
jgi:RNA polymerase sigma-70 factor, ECF subfamily